MHYILSSSSTDSVTFPVQSVIGTVSISESLNQFPWVVHIILEPIIICNLDYVNLCMCDFWANPLDKSE